MKVSALCVTKDRPEHLKEAIRYFSEQTYLDKELIVVIDPRGSRDKWLGPYLAQTGLGHSVRPYMGRPGSLGALRNLAIEKAHGEVLVNWDDDNLYHPRRIEEQVRHLRNMRTAGSVLRDYLWYFKDTAELFLLSGSPHGGPGSITWLKESGFGYADKDRSEERRLIRNLEVNGLGILKERPHLYVRVFHGKNTWDRKRNYGWALDNAASKEFAEKMAPLLARNISYFNLPRKLRYKGGEVILEEVHA